MKVKRIEHVAIAVKSLAKAREIFEDKLGSCHHASASCPHSPSKRLANRPRQSQYSST